MPKSLTQLEIAIAVVAAGGIDTVLVGDDLPELKNNFEYHVASTQCNDLIG